MRLIDADALVYELTEMVRHNTGEYKNGIAVARLVVMDTPTANGWVSVKDRLPDNSGLYLTWCKSPLGNRGFYRLSDYKVGNGWYDWVHHDYSDSYVVFWMPLPEPPKEERT